jgi:hypothetical protein
MRILRTGKTPRGRKPRYTPHEVANALHETKGMQFVAAKRLGCSQDTIARYIERYALVRQAARYERGEMIDVAELKLWQAIQNGEPWAIKLCLMTLGKDRGYVERQEHTGADGKEVNIRVVYETTRLPSKAPSREQWMAEHGNGHATHGED